MLRTEPESAALVSTSGWGTPDGSSVGSLRRRCAAEASAGLIAPGGVFFVLTKRFPTGT